MDIISWVMLVKYFYGQNGKGPYFEGWYFRCQTREGKGLALIPALHMDENGTKTASIQLITEDRSCLVDYPYDKFRAQRDELHIEISGNRFSADGIALDISREGMLIRGSLRFGPLCPLGSDIMGPLRFVPGLECRHSVFSMYHSVGGTVEINGSSLDFTGGIGYIEGDRGTSFPKRYLWIQDGWENGSFMLSVAEIPLVTLRFTGCICAFWLEGRLYRIATYRGARVIRWNSEFASVRQGKYRVEVRLLEQNPKPLKAPDSGRMLRTVHECIRSRVQIRILMGDRVLADRISDRAAFEFSDFTERNP